MGGTRSRGAAFWLHHVEQYRQGGLSLREYCECHGLKLSTFGHWRRRVARQASKATSPPVPVNIVRVDLGAAPAQAPALEVVLGNGRRIRVANDFDEGTLARVVTTLEALS